MIVGIDPKVDYAFKHLLGREVTRPILIEVLENVLNPGPGHHIQAVELLNPFNPKEAFDDKLARELVTAGSLGYEVTLVLCDLDEFKLVNDRHGHLWGDEVLRAVGRILAGRIRDRDVAARYGGEELALILPGTPLLGGRRLSERIRRKLEGLEIETESGERIPVTASFGAASFPTHGSPASLVAAADSALYEAKDGGRNRVMTATARKKLESREPAPAGA